MKSEESNKSLVSAHAIFAVFNQTKSIALRNSVRHHWSIGQVFNRMQVDFSILLCFVKLECNKQI